VVLEENVSIIYRGGHPVIGFGDHVVCDSPERRARVAAGQSTADVMDCHLVPDAIPTSTYVLWGLGVLVLVGGVWYLAR
jgi:hypothetical protein